MKDFFARFKKLVLSHKFTSLVVAIVIVWGGYYVYGKLNPTSTETRYVLAAVSKGTIVSSVSGTGQVSASNQIDIKPQVSGTVLAVYRKDGDYVNAGGAIGQLDTTDAEKAIRDAQANLDSAKLQLSIFEAGSGNVDNLISDAFNEVSNVYLDLPSTIAGLYSAIYDPTISSYTNLIAPDDHGLIEPLIAVAQTSYQNARASYDQSFSDYHFINRQSASSTIIAFTRETSDTVTKLADAVKSTINLIDFVNDYDSQRNRTLQTKYATLISTYRTNLAGYTTSLTSDISSLSSTLSSIDDAPLNLASQELTVQQRQNALQDAKDTLAEYTITAPFSGTVTNIGLKVGDSASPSTVAATLVTTRRIAEVSLNEVDVAKVKVGEKATLTFDAFPDLTIAGEVSQVDTIGTVSQGVVSYNVQVTFDSQDTRIKPSMSVSAAIVTDVKQDVLTIPNSAVKTVNGTSYAEVLDNVPANTQLNNQGITSNVPPRQVPITTGISNGSMTEVASGLNEGELVVVRTINGSNAVPAVTSQSTNRTGGGGIRVLGGFGG